MTATQTTYPAGPTVAPRFVPRPERAPAPRPYLRLVDPAELRRRRLARLLTGVFVAAACAGLFAIVALRVVLAQGQARVDRLEASVDAQTADQQQLRVQVAELSAPAQIVAAARSRLGMVNPPTVIHLNPAPAPAPAR